MTVEAEHDLGAVSLVELAVRRLRAEILSGVHAPGARLVEEQLTRRFGISRGPLREAMRLLGQQGLVEHLPRRGVQVAKLSGRDIDELFSLRDALERFALTTALAAGPGAGTPGAAALARLEVAVETMERTTGADQAEAHRDVHRALVALAGHGHLQRMHELVLGQLQLYMATNIRREAQTHSPQEGARRHRRLLDAVASGDLERSLAELAHHGALAFLAPELQAPGDA
jgi:DNA-binding GntR family transcriptional regulator